MLSEPQAHPLCEIAVKLHQRLGLRGVLFLRLIHGMRKRSQNKPHHPTPCRWLFDGLIPLAVYFGYSLSCDVGSGWMCFAFCSSDWMRLHTMSHVFRQRSITASEAAMPLSCINCGVIGFSIICPAHSPLKLYLATCRCSRMSVMATLRASAMSCISETVKEAEQAAPSNPLGLGCSGAFANLVLISILMVLGCRVGVDALDVLKFTHSPVTLLPDYRGRQ